MLSHIESRKKVEIDLKEKIKAINLKYKENKKLFNSWWINLLEFIGQDQTRLKDFLEKLMKDLSTNAYAFNQYTIDLLHSKYTICGKEFATIEGLKMILVDELDKYLEARASIQNQLGLFYDDYYEDLIREAANCHLKRNNGRFAYSKNKCELCKCEVLFNQYKKFIFSSSQIDEEALLTIFNKENEEQSTVDDDSNEKQHKKNELDDESTRQTIGDMEKFFRLIIKYCQNEIKLKTHRDIGKEFIEFNSKLKQEYYLMRRFWSSVSNEINSYDEIDMAKMRIRLKEAHDRDSKASYLVERKQIPYKILENKEEKKKADEKLRKKAGQLLYLTNLQKSFSIQNGRVENEELCPICQMNLDQQWYVLVCGHVFCIECTNRLTETQTECRCENCLIRNGLNRRNVQCAMCREVSRCDEIHLVGNKPTINNNTDTTNTLDSEFELKGDSNSTKIEGIVKCIMKIIRENPQEKCLVFSSYSNMLDLIQESLKTNSINHRYLKEGINSNKNLIDFKTDKHLNVLLVPYNFGASGLNLIEVTHIILVEPNLNLGQEAQAIGRIHRLGQNKKTYVHRFLVKNSIEDLIYNMVIKTKTNDNRQQQQQDSASILNKAELSIADLLSVINNL
jgi:E3 ubiquitin-protein ligase SHPRH